MKEETTLSRQFEKVNTILKKNGYDSYHLISILQEIQEEYRFLPEEILTYVATAMRLSPAFVYGVATFYAQFSLKPKGEHIIRVCDGTACHVRGSTRVLQIVREQLGLRGEEDTTDDLMFTVETVACIGACALAPALMVDDEVYGQMDEEKIKNLIEELLDSKKEGIAHAL